MTQSDDDFAAKRGPETASGYADPVRADVSGADLSQTDRADTTWAETEPATTRVVETEVVERAPPAQRPRAQGASKPSKDKGSSGLGAAVGAAAMGFVAGVAANKARKVAVQGLEATKGDWLDVLKAEHRVVDEIFDKLLQTQDSEKAKRAKLLVALQHALGKHALQEEDVVYPALRQAGVETEAKELYSEHGDIKTYLHELEERPKDDPAWLDRVRALQTLIKHHVEEEENEIYPGFRDGLSKDENAKLTKRMHLEGLKLA